MSPVRHESDARTWWPAVAVLAVMVAAAGAASGQPSPRVGAVTCVTFGQTSGIYTILLQPVGDHCEVDPNTKNDLFEGTIGGIPMQWQVCNTCGQTVDVELSNSRPFSLTQLFTSQFIPTLDPSGFSVAQNVPVGQTTQFTGPPTSSTDVANTSNQYTIGVKFTNGMAPFVTLDPQLQLDEGSGAPWQRWRLILAVLAALGGMIVAFMVGHRFGRRRAQSP